MDEVASKLIRLGYDAIELKGEPAEYKGLCLRRVFDQEGLYVSSICGMYPGPNDPRDLSHPEHVERSKAIDYVRSCIDLAGEVGAPLVIVTPNPVGRTRPISSYESERSWAIDSVRAAGEYALQSGVLLAIEPINRYETYLINTAEQCLRFVKDVGLSSVRMMLDTFHMNIEDKEPSAVILASAEHLIHLHIADNNRQSVGRGHINFLGIMDALRRIGYSRALAMEPLPPLAHPYQAMSQGFSSKELFVLLDECIKRLKPLEKQAI